MNRPRIVLVGNGPSLLERQLGEEIDAFPEVVRFNGFQIHGFEANVGRRTTIWSRFFNVPAVQPMGDLSRIWLNMPVHDRTAARINEAMRCVAPYEHKVEIIPSLEVAEATQSELFGDSVEGKWPSSGLLAIAHTVSQGWYVAIAGFDSWSKEPFHYYGVHDRRGSHHVAERERAYIERRINAGLLVRL